MTSEARDQSDMRKGPGAQESRWLLGPEKQGNRAFQKGTLDFIYF